MTKKTTLQEDFADQQPVGTVQEHTFFTPPVAGALFLAALVASCLRGALPPVDLRAVCLVRAMAFKCLQAEGKET